MRLIDADKLKQDMIKSHEYHSDTSELNSALERDIKIIDEQQTAYDVYKVIEELKELAIEFELFGQASNYVELSHAIDIVKKGGCR
jgi:hypothetical protein